MGFNLAEDEASRLRFYMDEHAYTGLQITRLVLIYLGWYRSLMLSFFASSLPSIWS